MALAWTFDTLTEEDREALVARKQAAERGDRRLLCAACGHPLTRPEARIPVHGAHRHTFTNPHGQVFTIGCFGDAPGCTEIGRSTEEWTWFAGFEWRVAVCGGCGTHVGWGYSSSAGKAFFGLILERLIAPG